MLSDLSGSCSLSLMKGTDCSNVRHLNETILECIDCVDALHQLYSPNYPDVGRFNMLSDLSGSCPLSLMKGTDCLNVRHLDEIIWECIDCVDALHQLCLPNYPNAGRFDMLSDLSGSCPLSLMKGTDCSNVRCVHIINRMLVASTYSAILSA